MNSPPPPYEIRMYVTMFTRSVRTTEPEQQQGDGITHIKT
jgi:hypothetical protein